MEEQKTGYFERNKHLAHGIRLDFMFNMLYGSSLSYAVSILFSCRCPRVLYNS